MRTHALRSKKLTSPLLPPRKEVTKSHSVGVPPVQAKSKEEGLAEWEAQRQKWERIGSPWMDKVPNPSGELAQPWIQRKLTLGKPNDKYEQEADRVASQVVQQINAPVSAQPFPQSEVQRQTEFDKFYQAKRGTIGPRILSLPPGLQRKGMPNEEDLQTKSTYPQRGVITEGEALTNLESAINKVRGRGQPLDVGLQQTMGQAMGADFSGVRVHTDAQSNQLNQSLQAKAFTTGQDVFFRQGAYTPEKRSGQELIAHELTHVVQQNGPCIQRSKKQVTSPALTDSSSSEVNLNESNHVVQRGLLEKHLGNANPRKHIPEAIGGYTPQQNQRNTTRAALRVIGLQDNVVETLIDIHLTRNPPLGYGHADMLTLGQGISNLGGTNVLAQRVVNIINTMGAPVLPVADLVLLISLHAARNDLDIANLATALLANPAWGAVRLRDLAQLPQNLAVPDIVTLAPLNLTPAGIGNLLAGPQNLTVPDIVTLAPLTRTLADIGTLLAGNVVGVPAPTVAEIVQLEGTSNADIGQLAGLGQVNAVAQIIQLKGALARGGARPLADLVNLGTNLPNLTVNELDALAVAPAVNNLGEYLVQDGIQQNRTADNVINESHTNANTGQRQAVANHDALRSVIRERWVAGGDATAIMATILEGSLYWPAGSGPEPSENYEIRLGSTFASWIRGGNENLNKPTANAVSTMNCWEGVLFAAYLAGKLTYLQLTNIHIQVATAANLIDPGGAGFAAFQAWDAGGRVGPIPLAAYTAWTNAQNAYYDGLAQFLNAHNSNPWDPTAMPLTGVPRGHIMFFTDEAAPTNGDKLEHVAISLGRGVGGNAEIMSHWNQPGNSFQYLTINQLFVGGYHPDVYTAPCPW